MQPMQMLSTLFCVVSRNGERRLPLSGAASLSGFSPGTQVQGRYQIQHELGRGGMGCVYLAKDMRLDRLVAIKVVAGSEQAHNPFLEDALAHEARLGAGLNHPAIAAVYDFGFHEERAFTVFEYVDGPGLRDLLEQRGRMTLEETRPVLGVLAGALDFAHSAGIVHRDLKPENIRASLQGQYKILDLGLAQDFRRSNDTTFVGTPAYASPEQAGGLPFDGRADQYALAVIAYEMLVGRRPFAEERTVPLLEMHRTTPPPSAQSACPDIPSDVSLSIQRALSKDPSARFASCEEFAAAIGATGSLHHRHRVTTPPEDDRLNLYLCHSGENAALARRLAEAIEKEGYSCWHYTYDALPGISSVAQTSQALRQCDAVVLMISPESMRSADVDREVREAHQQGRHFLPVLLGVTRQEFQQRQPDWQPILGSGAMVDLSAGNAVSVAARLLTTLSHWGIPPRPRRREHSTLPDNGPTAVMKRHAGGRKIWSTDANQIEIDDLDAVVFRNAMVDEFLERRNKFFLSASKGLGKTLLLTFKRSLLSRTFQQGGTGHSGSVTFIPQGRPYLDFMSDVRSLSRQHDQLISELHNTKRMWSLALAVSALSHHPAMLTDDDVDELALFPRRMKTWLRGSPIEPTVVFKELLSLSIREINRLIDDSENFLDQKLRGLHSGVYFFIDKVDQALRQLSQAAWVYVQAGLIEAAWDLMNANSHIKVHASIRQEAFSNYESDIKSNLFGATTLIHYSEQELHQMLDQLARCYEDSGSFHDFVALSVVKHPRRPFPEDSFSYVRRHTLGRPRDLVVIASELSSKRHSLSVGQFCGLVNETSARGLVSNIFDEMRVFLNCLIDKRERQRFLGLVPHNILTREEAIQIACEFNGLSASDYPHYQTHASGLNHPFCDLYRVGLLGVIGQPPDGGELRQTFKQPHDFIVEVESALPESPYYLLHPALDDHISQLQLGRRYHLFQHILVGDGQAWEAYFDLFCRLERTLFAIPDKRLHDMAYRVLCDARLVLSSDRARHLRSVLEGSANFQAISRQCEDRNTDRNEDRNYEELSYWLAELLDYGDRQGQPG
ncbi:protein kinase domain-containing protein [Lignipirellula cremea]|uniref:Serine/threonine-protein kinase PrkC n=1 Tax=Lignipirellula cremea TaxID=2528010 RepID=A0A518E4Q1_9BACT|nr:protein kinase [Lignipirellula cremea]QDU99070.1 Serine/threonine-protein kinase PrkC [Lignipirellula cremea]